MKINFEWNNISNNSSYKAAGKQDVAQDQSSLFLSGLNKAASGFQLSDWESMTAKMEQPFQAEEYIALQQDKMTLMSNTMSIEDFNKMKEEGYQPGSMEPDEIITILDNIKTELAKSGTHVSGYTDTISAETVTRITGNSGYAQAIVSELKKADAPVTEENIIRITEAVEQGLSLSQPGEGNKVYLVSNHKEPTISNLYKAGYTSMNSSNQAAYTGYASAGYSKYGLDNSTVRKMSVSGEELGKLEGSIKERIEALGLEQNQETLESGKWLLEKGLPVTEENLKLLQDLEAIEFPLDPQKLIKQGAIAIAEGKSPFDVKLNEEPVSIYEKAADIRNRFFALSPVSADYAASLKKSLNLVHMEEYQDSLPKAEENYQARKMLEEVRLKMTVEANIKLLRSGYSIDTAPMEELIRELDKVTALSEESIFGKNQPSGKAELFKETLGHLKELPALPLATVGKFKSYSDITLQRFVEEGRFLKQQYEAVKESYETMMTAPRADLGDNIKKAFRNVDDILEDMGLETSEANRRAIRIMGYNQITITEENLEKIKKADDKVKTIINKMKPGVTLEMIREGKNPLEMSMEEMEEYLVSKENEFLESTEKYSEFLYKLEKNNQISDTERKAYIGIYRLIRQIEKTDGAAIGSLLAQEAGLSFSNLLSAVRSNKAKGTDIRIDDSLGAIEKVIEKGISISDQIKAMETIVKEASVEKELQLEQLKEIRDIVKNTGKEKDYLEAYHQPVTIDGLAAVSLLTGKRGQAFSKVMSFEADENQTVEEMEESVLDHAREFIDSLEKEEKRNKNYDKLIEKSKQVLEESIEKLEPGYLNIKELQSVYKQLSVAQNLAREENYEIPVKIGEEFTSINLKVIHKAEEAGNIKIAMDTEVLGRVEARFILRDTVLEGSVLTDHMDHKNILESGATDLQKALEEALKETKTEIKGLYFGVNKGMDLNTFEGSESNSDNDISILYKVAKSFIRYTIGTASQSL